MSNIALKPPDEENNGKEKPKTKKAAEEGDNKPKSGVTKNETECSPIHICFLVNNFHRNGGHEPLEYFQN